MQRRERLLWAEHFPTSRHGSSLLAKLATWKFVVVGEVDAVRVRLAAEVLRRGQVHGGAAADEEHLAAPRPSSSSIHPEQVMLILRVYHQLEHPELEGLAYI
jgi:hypothetical protein